MRNEVLSYVSRCKIGWMLFFCCCFLICTGSVSVWAATQTTIVSGLNSGVGVAVDESKMQLYYVEYNGGTLKRINLPPSCVMTGTPSCSSTVTTIASGFTHPEDVQLDMAHGLAYVTTRDDSGTTGALWRVNTATGIKSMVTFNLGAPQQLALDIANKQAYVVGYDDGRLRRINLYTGSKTPVFMGLAHPVGLAITKDAKFAYVTEQDAPARVTKIDLINGIKDPLAVATGFTAPFFLAWTDASQNALYAAERDPANKVSLVDLITRTKSDMITGLPLLPSGIAVLSGGTPAYVTTNNNIVKVDLSLLTTSDPVFMGVGHIPYSKINDGFATCMDAACILKVRHAPFGGTPQIFANLTNFVNLGATHCEVIVTKGGVSQPLAQSWYTFKWNSATMQSDQVSIAPAEMGTRYLIPLDLDPADSKWKYRAELWYHPFQIMTWPSGEDGTYQFQIKIYKKSGATWTDITYKLPAALNNLTLRIDNTPPVVSISEISQGGTIIEACEIVKIGSNAFTFKINAYDPNGHLYSYGLSAMYGDNKSCAVASESYESYDPTPEIPLPPPGKHAGEGPLWNGYMNKIVPAASWSAQCNCAYTFYLGVWKRTIDGWNWIMYRDYHKSITIDLPLPMQKCTSAAGCTP
ncbi:MAG: YncE family protein [Kiritimatiellae bacterium]|nr:YncE family protein [Kiritimatiellia bacterium]